MSTRSANSFSVIPAEAGIQAILGIKKTWMPVFAGMTIFYFA
jgi:hypothetical protein